MRDSFTKFIDDLIQSEGGDKVTKDPDDPGGTTKYGISQRAYPDLDIENLTFDQAAELYQRDYWNKIDGDNLPYPLDICVFDCAVNQGVGRAKQFLAVSDCWQDFELHRLSHYKRLGKRKYYEGWVNRVVNLFDLIQKGIS